MGNHQAWMDLQEMIHERPLPEKLPEPIDAADLLNHPEPPDWYRREMEYQYRKGFYHGIAEASELIVRLYRSGGYVRPQEISNILGDWCNDLRRWKSSSVTEQPLKADCGTPALKFTPWQELKSQAFARDGGVCAWCGSSDELEGHHIEPVKNGGLPILENILTLCFTCHRAKPT